MHCSASSKEPTHLGSPREGSWPPSCWGSCCSRLVAAPLATEAPRRRPRPPPPQSTLTRPVLGRPGSRRTSQPAAQPPGLSPDRRWRIISELQPVIPPPEVVEQVLAAASHPAPESELSLQDCTDWIADPAISLEPVQTQECAAMLAAAVDTCRELDCFATPADTVPPDTAPADTVPPDQVAAVVTTMSAASRTTPEPTTTAAPTAALASPTTTAAPTTAAPDPDPGPEPEGGHPPLPSAGMVPRDEPYWDYPTCSASPPWPSDCYPPRSGRSLRT